MHWSKAGELAAATPPDRDRYIDFLRLFSIVVVVVGHWLMAVVWYDGELHISHILAEAGWTHYLTWVLQVMPVFFIVGGFANARSWTSARRRGATYRDWLQGRTARLIRPTVVFAAVWAAAVYVLLQVGVDAELLRTGTQVVAVPLWFLAVYLLVVVLGPLMIGLDERFGWVVTFSLFGVAAIVDGLHHGLSVPVVGVVNFIVVWLGIHQLGIRWQRGAVPATTRGAGFLAAAGLAGLVGLTIAGPYPASMVGVPGAEITNTLPPTVALAALAALQFGIILALRRPVSEWLQRPHVWTAVIVGNARMMTVYLWHLTAMITVLGAALLAGGAGLAVRPLTPAWWWSRIVWVAVLALPLMGLIMLFGGHERNRTSAPASGIAVVTGIPAVIWGFASVALHGFVTVTGGVAVMPALAIVAGSRLVGVRSRRTG